MSDFVLANDVSVLVNGSVYVLQAGKTLSDEQFDLDVVRAAGGVLYPASTKFDEASAMLSRANARGAHGGLVDERTRLNVLSIDVPEALYQPSVFWKPAGGGDFETFEQIYELIKETRQPCRIYVGDEADGPYVIPAPEDEGAPAYDMRGSWFESSRIAQPVKVTITPGAVLRNLRANYGVILSGAPTTSPCLVFDPDPVNPFQALFFEMRFTATLENLGTVPMIEAGGTGALVLFLFDQANGFSTASTAPIVDVPAGRRAILIMNMGRQVTLLPNNAFSGTGTLVVGHDGSLPGPFPFFSGFGGTVINSASGIAGGAGPTANRPAGIIGPIPRGCLYFDTTLGRPVWWNGAGWVDATGAAA